MRRQRRRRGFLGGFGELRLSDPWEKVGPLTFVRREDFGDRCGEVVASVTCPPRMRAWRGPWGRGGRFLCNAEVRFNDPQTDTVQRITVRSSGGKTPEEAAESAILQTDLAVSRVRVRCRQDVRYPVRYPGFSPGLVQDTEEVALPPACRCERKWSKVGWEQTRACGQGYSMHLVPTGFSLRDPISLQLRQGIGRTGLGERVWQGQVTPEFLGYDNRGRELWQSRDDAIKAGKKMLARALKTVCEAEEAWGEE